MLEKKVYIVSSRWGGNGSSYWKHCLNNRVVFINNEHDSETDFPKIARGVKKGDIIALRNGQNMCAVGIANNDAVVKNILTGKPLFTSKEELLTYGIGSKVDAVYITVYEWYEFTNKDKSIFDISGLQDRIKLLPTGKYDDARKKIIDICNREKLEQKMDENKLMQSVENLLKNNHNLVLTGAPGTGKTHLAKRIAAKMIFCEDISLKEIEQDEEKKKKFNEQYKFVQFHPSYDYTDFVEGIRPVIKEDNNSGFERKDGVFKKFCKRAVRNIIDSQKTLEVLSKEEIILKYLDKFTDDIIQAIDENDVYALTAQLNVDDFEHNDNGIKFGLENNQNTVTMYNEEIIKMYNFYSNTVKKNKDYLVNDFLKYTKRRIKHATYYHNFIKNFYDSYGKQIDQEISVHKNAQLIIKKPFIFIIDEINRGDFNKIFGELFYAIDPGYRGEKGIVDTQYQNLVDEGDIFVNGFYIPENVYIIGTMNDIDRSVESMDFAIRRRFAWQEIAPKDTAAAILKKVKIQNAELILEKFNELIASPECLGKMYQLGASYFLKLNNYIDDYKVNDTESIKEAYKKLWNNHLHGLIYEYVRGKKSGDDIYKKIYDKYLELTGINPIAPNKEEQQEQED